MQPLARVHPTIDGIVAIAHTEGGGQHEPNNTTEILRALAGFMVHSNVSAVLAIDYGVEPITNARLRDFMRAHRYPLDHVLHEFLTLNQGLAAGLAAGKILSAAGYRQSRRCAARLNRSAACESRCSAADLTHFRAYREIL